MLGSRWEIHGMLGFDSYTRDNIMNAEIYNIRNLKTGKNLFKGFVGQRAILNKVRKIAGPFIDTWLSLEYYIGTNDLELLRQYKTGAV